MGTSHVHESSTTYTPHRIREWSLCEVYYLVHGAISSLQPRLRELVADHLKTRSALLPVGRWRRAREAHLARSRRARRGRAPAHAPSYIYIRSYISHTHPRTHANTHARTNERARARVATADDASLRARSGADRVLTGDEQPSTVGGVSTPQRPRSL